MPLRSVLEKTRSVTHIDLCSDVDQIIAELEEHRPEHEPEGHPVERMARGLVRPHPEACSQDERAQQRACAGCTGGRPVICLRGGQLVPTSADCLSTPLGTGSLTLTAASVSWKPAVVFDDMAAGEYRCSEARR